MMRKKSINREALNGNENRKEFIMKMEAMYIDRGLPEVCVDSEQIKALHKENNSERQAY